MEQHLRILFWIIHSFTNLSSACPLGEIQPTLVQNRSACNGRTPKHISVCLEAVGIGPSARTSWSPGHWTGHAQACLKQKEKKKHDQGFLYENLVNSCFGCSPKNLRTHYCILFLKGYLPFRLHTVEH